MLCDYCLCSLEVNPVGFISGLVKEVVSSELA